MRPDSLPGWLAGTCIAYTLAVPAAGSYALRFAGTQAFGAGTDDTTYLDEVNLERSFVANGDFEQGTQALAAP